MKKSLFTQTILHEDKDYLIVNKPPHISTLSDRQTPHDYMLLHAKKYCPTAQACHRLDKSTSGALVFAKNPIAYRHLSQQFTQQTVEKIYHAVLEGIHTLQNTEVNAPLTLKSSNKAIIDFKHGKKAITHFHTHTYFKQHTLVICKPLTGKTHQIRLHASYLKAPIVGDLLYDGHSLYLSQIKKNYKPNQNQEERPLIPRVALHAHKITFKSLHQEPIHIQAPYPKDFQALINQLTKHT